MISLPLALTSAVTWALNLSPFSSATDVWLAQAEVPGWSVLGVNSVLAGMMFHFVRKDAQAHKEELQREAQRERQEILQILNRYETLAKSFRGVIEGNTAALTKLDTHLQARCPFEAQAKAAGVGR